jgi:hypothetical protein
VAGEVQALKGWPSSWHSNVASGSLDVKLKVAVFVFTVPVGPPAAPAGMAVCGATRSRVKELVAGVWSVPPAPEARTAKVYMPSLLSVYVFGEVHVVKPADWPGPVSSHWNEVEALSERKLNVGVLSVVGPAGPESISVSGATVSTVNDSLSGEGSTLPAASLART